MDGATMEAAIEAVAVVRPGLVVITGGAPELTPDFRGLIEELARDGRRIEVRTNLTVLTDPGRQDLPEFYRNHRVQLTASMPCYLESNVRAQRGPEVYEKSVAAIRALNRLGYGAVPDLVLNLAYNPGGAFLPPAQAALEADYKRELGERHGIAFTRLFTIANMPIGRFRDKLRQEGKEREYLDLLARSFNPDTLAGLMCRHQVSIGPDGSLYDCDFNLALGMRVNHGAPDHVSKLTADTAVALASRPIVTGSHCFGCAAGSGSSCGGALA
jgi:radical SAM/Cys-rich protein